MNNAFWTKLMAASLVLAALTLSGLAYAENCNLLESNPEWIKGFEMMSMSFKQEDYKAALQHAKKLTDICASSPTLTFTLANIYKKLGDHNKSKYYYQQATINAAKFDVPMEMQEKMWASRIFVENPESRPEAVAERKAEIESLKSELDRKTLDLQALQAIPDDNNLSNMRLFQAAMWSGVGVGVAGLVMTITGAVLLATEDKPLKYDKGDAVIIKGRYSTSHGLLGAGIASTVLGAAVAGVFAYKYVQLRKESNIELSISPNFASLNITF